MADHKEVDQITGVETTGHEWDGIKELNNPLPDWWRWILYACIVWSFGYWIVYPAIPLVNDYTRGVFGYSSRAEVAVEISTAKQAQSAYVAKMDAATLEEIRTQSDLLEFALAGGRSAFSVNCSQCHGSGAQGFAGYPNLNDDEWLWGGTMEEIQYTITHGVRNETDDDAHASEMPAFLRDEILSKEEIANVAEYIMKLSGQEFVQATASQGEAIFAEQCTACHGDNGAGDTGVGAPALNNNIWLYAGDRDTVIETISNSRNGVMPAWGGILGSATVKQLAVYVHSLGGGQ